MLAIDSGGWMACSGDIFGGLDGLYLEYCGFYFILRRH